MRDLEKKIKLKTQKMVKRNEVKEIGDELRFTPCFVKRDEDLD